MRFKRYMSSLSTIPNFIKERVVCPKPHKDNLVAFCVSVNFADKLEISLKNNLRFVKKLYVATIPSDAATIDVCKQYGVETILVDARKINERGAKFNLSCFVYEAQKLIHERHKDDWIIKFDADTLFPTNFWACIDSQGTFYTDSVYGFLRAIYQDNYAFKAGRISSVCENYGFFQMYFSKSHSYDAWSKDCSRCDVFFERRFKFKVLMDGGTCAHLGNPKQDWEGRRSATWGSKAESLTTQSQTTAGESLRRQSDEAQVGPRDSP